METQSVFTQKFAKTATAPNRAPIAISAVCVGTPAMDAVTNPPEQLGVAAPGLDVQEMGFGNEKPGLPVTVAVPDAVAPEDEVRLCVAELMELGACDAEVEVEVGGVSTEVALLGVDGAAVPAVESVVLALALAVVAAVVAGMDVTDSVPVADAVETTLVLVCVGVVTPVWVPTVVVAGVVEVQMLNSSSHQGQLRLVLKAAAAAVTSGAGVVATSSSG